MEQDPSRKVLTLICPNLRCRSLLQVPESVRGQKVRCGKCGRNLLVPQPAKPAPAAAPAPTNPTGKS